MRVLLRGLMDNNHCVVIGAGQAAAQLTARLRQNGWQGMISVVGDEQFLPYHRPPLSKDYLSGEKSVDDLMIRPSAAYENADVQFRLGSRAESIDQEAKKVLLGNGKSISFSKLVLATGSRLRKLPVPGADLPGVFYLRSISDVKQIKTYVGENKKAVVIGGGYIGLETAAVLKKLGMEVTVLEAMNRVLERVTTPEISAFYTRVHEQEGVQIRTNLSASSIKGVNEVDKVVCQNGQEFAADMVIIGIGVLPETELAENAGLEVDNGILVNEFAQTSNPDILAAGDCTNHFHPFYDRHIRLESVQNAVDQSTVAANTICDMPSAYNSLPWFWSDQYDIKLQIAGLCDGYDEVVLRGDISTGRSFTAFYLKDGKIITVTAINKPQEFMVGKRLIVSKLRVDKASLSDTSIPIKELVE